MTNLRVVVDISHQYGWDPISHLAHLVAHYFDAPLIHQFDAKPLAHINSFLAAAYLWKRKRNPEGENLLFITARPSGVLKLVTVPGYKNRFNKIAVWVVDSFWTDKILPKWINSGVDKFFITTDEINVYEEKTGVPSEYLPWGSDVLQTLGFQPNRNIDLLRLGRQPLSWQSDQISFEACAKVGMKFSGSPPPGEKISVHDRYLNLRVEYLKRAKFILAFSNLSSGSTYTHPSKEYFTARWTDSLACGAILAGIPPKTDTLYSSLWPGALLELQSHEFDDNIRDIRSALDCWSDHQSHVNIYMSLKRLDWRHRFVRLAVFFGMNSETLNRDLEKIESYTLSEITSTRVPV